METQYLGYYGYPYYWGGGGLWGGALYPNEMAPGFVGFRGDRVQSEEAAHSRAWRARHRKDDPHLRSCNEVIGYHIHATDGEIGHIDGLIVDEDTWAIRYIVVNTSNWWVGHKVLMDPEWITDVRWLDQSVSVDLTRESVKDAPPYDSTAELNRHMESALYEYYGRPQYWTVDTVVEAEI
jgi:hypothetical protein